MPLPLSRRRFLGEVILPATAIVVQACGGSATPTPTSPPPTTAPTPTIAPTIAPSPTSAAATPTPIPQNMTSPDYSIQGFLWGSDKADRDLGLAKVAGFRWFKQSIEWRYVEPHVKGTYEFNEPDRLLGIVAQLGLKLLARVDNQPAWARKDLKLPNAGPPDNIQDYADFLNALAKRYKGKIQAYQIWNEPNLAREWGNQPPDPVHYVALLKAAYQAIKAEDPDAQIISAGLAPTTASGAIAMPDIEFINQMYKAGGGKFFDLLGAHGAGYKAPPEASPDDVGKDSQLNHGEGAAGRIYCFRHVEDVRKVMVDNGDSAKRLAILEIGWTVDPRPTSPYKWHAVTEQQQSDYLIGAYKWAKTNWQPWIGVMSAIYVASPTWTPNDEEYYWSLTLPNGTVRPAFAAFAAAPK